MRTPPNGLVPHKGVVYPDVDFPFGVHHRPHLPPSPETKRGGGSFQTTRCRGDSSTDLTCEEA